MSKIKYLILFLIIGMSNIAISQTTEAVKSALQKMLTYYADTPDMAVEYLVYSYATAEDKNPDLLSTMNIVLEKGKLYYQYENKEYYQNEMGSIGFDHDEKWLRLAPVKEKKKKKEMSVSSMITTQLETLITACDSILYEGRIEGKKAYTLYLLYSGYDKVTMLLNEDHSLFKTTYYYENNSYGYKSETLIQDLPVLKYDKIKVGWPMLDEVINNNACQSYFENYQLLEIE